MRTSHPGEHHTQENNTSRGTSHTGEQYTQENITPKRTIHPGEHHTQGNITPRRTSHPGEHHTQENNTSRGTTHPGEQHTQENITSRGTAHTTGCNQHNNRSYYSQYLPHTSQVIVFTLHVNITMEIKIVSKILNYYHLISTGIPIAIKTGLPTAVPMTYAG
jgi:hypothetical protein